MMSEHSSFYFLLFCDCGGVGMRKFENNDPVLLDLFS